jgi:uncharacterized membrane protein
LFSLHYRLLAPTLQFGDVLSYTQFAYVFVGVALIGFLCLFVEDSIRWKRHRAVVASFGIMIVASGIWVGWWLLIDDGWLLNLLPATVLVLAALFLLPIGRADRINIGQSYERVDERDTMFAREDYVPGTHEYEMYYRMRPKLRDIDDRIRSLPPLCKPGGKYYEPELAAVIDSIFTEIRSWTGDVDGEVAGDKVECNTRIISEQQKSALPGSTPDGFTATSGEGPRNGDLLLH